MAHANTNQIPEMPEVPEVWESRLSEVRPPDYALDHVKLIQDIRSDTRVEVSTTLSMRLDTDDGDDRFPWLELDRHETLAVEGIRLNGVELKEGEGYHLLKNKVLLHPGIDTAALRKGFTVEIDQVVDPTQNKEAGQGLYWTNGGTLLMSQYESLGFARTSVGPNRPDVMPTWETILRADKEKCPVLLATGNETERRDLDDGRHEVTFEHDHKLAPYLSSSFAGKLEFIEKEYVIKYGERAGKPVKVRVYAEPGMQDRCHIVLNALLDVMAWDEEEYGFAYDLDEYSIIVASDFNFGAMENKGRLLFGAKNALLNRRYSTDGQILHGCKTAAHEHMHNIRGNRVGLASWHEIGLKEGLTSDDDRRYFASRVGATLARIEHVRDLRGRQFDMDAGAAAHPIRREEIKGDPMSAGAYSATVYVKGAEVFHMMEELLGREAYRAGMRQYYKDYDGKAARIDEVVTAMEKANDVDLTQHRLWFKQVGTPKVDVSCTRLPDGTLSMTVRQECPKPPLDALLMPMRFGFVGPDGEEVDWKLEGNEGSNGHDTARGVLRLSKPEHTFIFSGVPEGSVPSLFRGFSAPVKINYNYSMDDLRHLMVHDTDGFNRFDACERLAHNCLFDLIARIRGGEAVSVDDVDSDLLDVYGLLIAQASQGSQDSLAENLGILTEMLTLPSIDTITQTAADKKLTPHYDYDSAKRARDILQEAIGRRFEDEFVALHEQYRIDLDKDLSLEEVDVSAIQTRSLKNLCLEYLTHSNSDHTPEVQAQFDEPNNMSNEVVALRLLLDDPLKRQTAIDRFTERWSDEPLVMDRLLNVAARIDDDSALSLVRAFMESDDFQWTRPAGIYALLVFGLGENYTQLHRADGEGYRLVADALLKMQTPSVAGRMMRELFGAYTKIDDERSALAKAQLERVYAEHTNDEIKLEIYKLLHPEENGNPKKPS